jgi:cellulose synthase/poly-beta-1,6-N-acetylglucosamine synthase-like glycosyltransferase
MGDQRRWYAGSNRTRAPIPKPILARPGPAAQPARAPQPRPSAPHEYAFLVPRLISWAALVRAEAEAHACGVATHEVLLAAGVLCEEDYAAVLAYRLGVPLVGWDAELDLGTAEHASAAAAIELYHARQGGRAFGVLAATSASPAGLAARVAELRAQGTDVALASRHCIEAAIEAQLLPHRIDRAVHGLLAEQPRCSAAAGAATWQTMAAAIFAGLAIGGVVVLPDATHAAATALIALPFLCVTLLRGVALQQALIGPQRAMGKNGRRRGIAQRGPDWQLPTYTVLVPLLDEADGLPDLVRSLCALDYPPAKLEIFLVLEAADTATQAAMLDLALPGNFRTLVVPDREPRTKPKALNYALQFARGDFVVVYDAEDRPQSDQLRRAWEVFRAAPPGLGCLQAQLNIYNPRDSWLTRQFTIEYSALFDAILPALERLRLPVPLGGTSNHFPRTTLIEAGAWDPHNVTEDADLGIRLARQGYHTRVLASTTWEEAPPRLRIWFKQRTRWLKGWMQTYLVHTRDLARLHRDLGLRASIGFHALMGGLIVSALVHPLFYVQLAAYWLSGELLAPAETTAGAVLWAIACINLALGYFVSILVSMVSVWRRGRRGLAMFALLLPFYWLLISLAAYRAAWQFARDPYLWEKTEHGAGRRR